MGIQCILNHFAMKTLILFCLFSISLSATDIELFSPAEDRTVCCLTATNNCASYCAGRSCTATCSVRCGILMSSCGTVTCSSVASSTCVAAPTPSQLQSLLLYLLLYQLLPLFLPLLLHVHLQEQNACHQGQLHRQLVALEVIVTHLGHQEMLIV